MKLQTCRQRCTRFPLASGSYFLSLKTKALIGPDMTFWRPDLRRCYTEIDGKTFGREKWTPVFDVDFYTWPAVVTG